MNNQWPRVAKGTAVIALMALALSACARQTTQSGEPAKAAAPAAKQPIPADSPLAKIREGMGMKEVTDLLGQPTDTNSHITGKAFIPYYYGNDTAQTVAYYKGMGRVILSHGAWTGLRVTAVEYDPSEPGYTR